MKKLGLIVNPIAGMGGAVGLKGTDGPALLERAQALGAVPRAQRRAESALAVVAQLNDMPELVTYSGAMGETAAAACGLKPTIAGSAASYPSTTDDTREAANRICAHGVDLLLFAGGDGTARDIHDAVGRSLVCLGIPAGVKIQSAVFGTSPAVAGQIAASFISGTLSRTKQAEVMDINEEEYRKDILSARLFGYLEIPDASQMLQSRKAASAPSESVLQRAIAADVVEQMKDEVFCLIGPGTTCRAVMEQVDLEASLLGVDLVRAGRLVGKDLNEGDILEAIGNEECRLVLTPIGGQGFLLGRGNQQISPEVLHRVGKGNFIVVATTEKLSSLRGRPLLVDTGDLELDRHLRGYYRVVTGYRETTIYKVSDRL